MNFDNKDGENAANDSSARPHSNEFLKATQDAQLISLDDAAQKNNRFSTR